MSLWARLNRRLLIRYRLEYVVMLAIVYGVRALSPAFAWGLARQTGRLAFDAFVAFLARLAIGPTVHICLRFFDF